MLTTNLHQAVESVFEADRKIVDLVQGMSDAFDFVQDVQKLQDRALHLQKSIDGLLKQTIECCIFVCQYTSQGFIGKSAGIAVVRCPTQTCLYTRTNA